MIYSVPTTEQTLQTLCGKQNPYQDSILIQAPKTNTIDINFGPKNDVSHFLEPGASVSLPVKSLSAYAIKAASSGQTVIITTM